MKVIDKIKRKSRLETIRKAQEIISENRIAEIKRYDNEDAYTHDYQHILRGKCIDAEGWKFNPVISYRYDEKEKNIEEFKTECDCYYGGRAICLHQIALVIKADSLGLLERTSEEARKALREKQVKKIKDFMEALSESDNGEKRLLSLKCEPFIDTYNERPAMLLDISIGPAEGKKYKLNSKIKDFLNAYEEKDYSFGKNFTYSFRNDAFDSKSERIISILRAIDDITGSDEDYCFNEVKANNFRREGVVVPSIFMKEVIEILGVKSIGKWKLIKEKPKAEFELEKRGVEIFLHSKKLSNMVPMGDEFIIWLTSDGMSICCCDKRDVSRLKRIKGKFSEGENELKISFSAEDTPVSSLIQNLQEIGEVKIGPALKREILIPKDVKNEIYIESYGKYGIKLREEILFDGIRAEEHSKIIVSKPGQSLLKKHEKGYGLNQISAKEYLMENDEDIYEFMTGKVFELKEAAEIFYEDKFSKRRYSKGAVRAAGALKGDVLSFEFSIEGIENEEISELLEGMKERKKFIRLRDGGILKIEGEEFYELEEILSNLKSSREEFEKGKIERERQYAYFLKERLQTIAGAEISQSLKKFVSQLGDVSEIEIPDQFHMLREYQRYGVSWLCFLKKYGLGGILADDMGLGKTLQTIAFLTMTSRETGRPTMIVAPKSLMYNWKNEFEKFAPEMSVKIMEGTKKKREEIIGSLASGDVILTSYGTIQKDKVLYEEMEFENIILDEAQNIKNIGTKTTTAVKELKGKNRVALTGTPVENNLMELWSIFDFIMPGYLRSHAEFEKRFVKSVNYKTLKALITPFILRRMKKDVLTELPEKIESSILVELLPEQKKIYLAYLKKAQKEVEESGGNSMVMFSVLTRLRQICSHPGMFLEDYKGESSKVELLLELLREYKDSGHRVLVFSQFTKLFDIIKEKIGKEYRYKYLDGSTSSKDRIKLVEEFNSGDGDVFLISLKAGGTGLNLTGADTVIHFDPWWNPAVEEQATDRAYRIGQKNIVNVSRFITAGTIEEKIDKLKAEKKALVQELFDGELRDIMKLDKNEILELLKV